MATPTSHGGMDSTSAAQLSAARALTDLAAGRARLTLGAGRVQQYDGEQQANVGTRRWVDEKSTTEL